MHNISPAICMQFKSDYIWTEGLNKNLRKKKLYLFLRHILERGIKSGTRWLSMSREVFPPQVDKPALPKVRKLSKKPQSLVSV